MSFGATEPRRAGSQGLSPEKANFMTMQGRTSMTAFGFLALPDTGSKTGRSCGGDAHVPTAEAVPSEDSTESIKLLALMSWQAYVQAQLREPAQVNPLVWWRDIGSMRYPYVEPIARRYASALATSAEVERTFSAAKFWCRDERALISDEHLEEMTILSSMLREPAFDLRRVFEGNPYATHATTAGAGEFEAGIDTSC